MDAEKDLRKILPLESEGGSQIPPTMTRQSRRSSRPTRPLRVTVTWQFDFERIPASR